MSTLANGARTVDHSSFKPCAGLAQPWSVHISIHAVSVNGAGGACKSPGMSRFRAHSGSYFRLCLS